MLPERGVDSMNGAVEGPTRRLGDCSLLHLRDAASVPQDRISPVVAQVPNVPANVHVSLLGSARIGVSCHCGRDPTEAPASTKGPAFAPSLGCSGKGVLSPKAG